MPESSCNTAALVASRRCRIIENSGLWIMYEVAFRGVLVPSRVLRNVRNDWLSRRLLSDRFTEKHRSLWTDWSPSRINSISTPLLPILRRVMDSAVRSITYP